MGGVLIIQSALDDAYKVGEQKDSNRREKDWEDGVPE